MWVNSANRLIQFGRDVEDLTLCIVDGFMRTNRMPEINGANNLVRWNIDDKHLRAIGACMTNAGVAGSPPLNPTSENMRITERFTRTDADTIEYEMKVEDQEVVVSPWAVAFPLKLDNKYQMFEYACHEGNMAIRGYIENSRFERAHPKPAGAAGPGRGRGGAGRGGAPPAAPPQ